MEPCKRGWTLAITALASFMGALDSLVVVTALPAMQRAFHAGPGTLEWTVNAYTLAAAAGIITAAAAGDRFGRRKVFSAGLIIFSLASAACAAAPNVALLIAARAVQGAGYALVAPVGFAILTSAFPAERRARVVGLWAGLVGLAIAGGPLVGGALTQGLDWHWIFWVNVPIGLVAAVAALLRLDESAPVRVRFDLPAVLLAGTGSTGLVYGLVTRNWGPADAGLALLAAFVLWERRVEAPMLPPRLFANRRFAAAEATVFLNTATVFGAAFLMQQYFQLGSGYSPFAAGLRFLPMTATPLIVAPLAGVVADRIGQRPVMTFGLLLALLGMAWFALSATAGTSYSSLFLPLLVAGTGVSMPFATAATAAMGSVASADIGKAAGANSTLQSFGGVFGIAVVTTFLGAGGFQTPLLADAGLAAIGLVSALLVGGGGRRRLLRAQEVPATA